MQHKITPRHGIRPSSILFEVRLGKLQSVTGFRAGSPQHVQHVVFALQVADSRADLVTRGQQLQYRMAPNEA
jgi:hypothetical protein